MGESIADVAAGQAPFRLYWRTHQQRGFALVRTFRERVTSWPVRRVIGFGGKRFVVGIILVDEPAHLISQGADHDLPA